MTSLIAYALFALLQCGDIWTTHRILSNGGRELNPILAKLFQKFGHLPVLITLKAAVTAAVWLLVADFEWLIWALVAFYVGIVAHNLKQARL